MKIIFLTLLLFTCLPSTNVFSKEETNTVFQQKKVTDRYQQKVVGISGARHFNEIPTEMIIDVIEMEDELHIYLRKYREIGKQIWKSVKPMTIKFSKTIDSSKYSYCAVTSNLYEFAF